MGGKVMKTMRAEMMVMGRERARQQRGVKRV